MTQGSEPVPLVSQGSMRTARLNRPFAGAAIDRACNHSAILRKNYAILRTWPINSTRMCDA